MLRTAKDMLTALRRGVFRGIILYEGRSLLDGKPIVAILNRIAGGKSRNGKTGAMVQSFIIRSDVSPLDALASGEDRSVCGDCTHRPFLKGKCYVQVGKSVMSVWRAYNAGRYARPGVDYDVAILSDLFEDLAFRGGTYGDPCAVPYMLWRRATLRAAFVNAYTHQWRDPRFQVFRLLAMASVDSEEEMREAQAMGWRTFRTRRDAKALERGVELVCPASKEARASKPARAHISCDKCKACGGLSASVKASMTIILHGPRVGKLELAA